MAATLGTAYVQIVPSAQGISGSISKALAPEAASAGNKAGSLISTNMSKKLQGASKVLGNVGTTLTNKVTKPAMVAGSALAGMVIGKGLQRLNAIDNARAKLSALGHDATSVKTIMDNATAAVKGTAFGLDEAANTAAAAVAARIQPGKELTRYLKLCGDAAAVAGVDMAEMGSIFNKVAANGKVSTEEMNQLADRGIPIWQLLSKETGMSMDELRKAVSEGAIDVNDFQGALERMGKGAGTVAQEMGSSTLSGALKNLWASVGRVGANFLSAGDDAEGVFDKLRDLVVKLTEKMGTFEEKAKVWGAILGEVFKGIIEYFKTGNPQMEGMSQKAQEVFKAIQPLVAILKAVGTWFMNLSTKGKLTFAGLVIGAGPMLTVISKAIIIFGKIKTIITGLRMAFMVMTGPVGLVVAAIAAAIAIGVLLYKNWDKIKAFLLAAWNVIKNAALAVWNAIKQTIVGVWNGIKTAATAVWNGIKTFFVTIFNIYKTIFTTAFNVIKKIVTGIFNGIKIYFRTVFNIYKTIFTTAFNGIKNVVTRIFNGIKNAITKPIEKAKETIKGIIDKIKGFFSFKVSLPKIKLPHFSISPKGWKFGDLLKGDIPSLGIDWYAKGGIMTKPTLFGGGEAGSEAIVPLDPFWNRMDSMQIDYERLAAAIATEIEKVTISGDVTLDGKSVGRLVSPEVNKSMFDQSVLDRRFA